MKLLTFIVRGYTVISLLVQYQDRIRLIIEQYRAAISDNKLTFDELLSLFLSLVDYIKTIWPEVDQ
jgi:hypothetical protein